MKRYVLIGNITSKYKPTSVHVMQTKQNLEMVTNEKHTNRCLYINTPMNGHNLQYVEDSKRLNANEKRPTCYVHVRVLQTIQILQIAFAISQTLLK